ncbi:MAG: hypothetical protein J6A88_01080 [Oscillospiraceae bacterium]|nr:hypothetical protein [Oscillospiraceae bacterium]
MKPTKPVYKKFNWKEQLMQPAWFYALWLVAMSIIYAFYRTEEWGALALLGGLAGLFLYFFRPSSKFHRFTLTDSFKKKTLATILVIVLTISICILPMNDFDLWNGQNPGHRNQYELMAENLLNGRLHFAYGDEYTLEGLENPYDPAERKEAGIYYHWDHAYYNGQYYMYFGIVPVLITFLPYRVITGEALTTYRATQVYTAVFILGIFALFHLLTSLFFKKLPYSVYLALSAAISVMSVWYASAEPALYCTAITAALALEIWSIYFFVKAVWDAKEENKQILYATVGAILGALVFGCRPSIALANIVVIPMLIVYLKKNQLTAPLLGKLILAAVPYLVVGLALMCYNYVRFDDPFEFGQAYQLTVADQTGYKFELTMPILVKIANGISKMLFGQTIQSVNFPYPNHGGAFFNFPILLLCNFAFAKPARKLIQEHKLTPLLIGLIVSVIIIIGIDVMWTPYILNRYYMDIYFLLGILVFICIGAWYESGSPKLQRWLNTVLFGFAALTVLCSFLFFVETLGSYYPGKVTELKNIFEFWKK